MKPVNALDEALAALWVARRQLSAQMDQIDKAIDALRVLDSTDRLATATKTKIAVAGGTKNKNWASRKKGEEPVADEAERFADAVDEAMSKNPRMALNCEEPDCWFSVSPPNTEAMNKHALAEHNRIAKKSERLPKAV